MLSVLFPGTDFGNDRFIRRKNAFILKTAVDRALAYERKVENFRKAGKEKQRLGMEM